MYYDVMEELKSKSYSQIIEVYGGYFTDHCYHILETSYIQDKNNQNIRFQLWAREGYHALRVTDLPLRGKIYIVKISLNTLDRVIHSNIFNRSESSFVDDIDHFLEDILTDISRTEVFKKRYNLS